MDFNKTLEIMLKFVKKIVITLLILIALIVSLSYLFARIYEKEIVETVVSELNSQLETKLDVASVNFTLLNNFPRATVKFDKVFLKSSQAYLNQHPKEDTLLYAQNIYLEFSLLDVINQKYELKHLSIKKANIYMKVDARGVDNYRITKTQTDSSDTKLNLDLRKVILNQVNYVFENKKNKNKFSLYAKKFALKGNFNDEEFGLSTSGTLLLNEIVLNDTKYLMYPNTALNTDLVVNQSKVEIKKGSLKIGNEYLNLVGSYWFDNQSYIDIKAQSDKMTIRNILAHLPKAQRDWLANYDAKGRLAFELSAKGEIAHKATPLIELKATVNDAEVLHSKSQILLNHLNFNAHFLSASNSLEISQFSGKLHESSAKGRFMIKHFKRPYISADLRLESNLSELKQFLELDSLKTLEGFVDADLQLTGTINNPEKITKNDIRTFRTQGHINLKDAQVEALDKSIKPIRALNATLGLDNNNVVVDSLSFGIDASTIRFKGKAYNALAYLLLEEEIRLNGDVRCDTLNLGNWLSSKDNSKEAAEPFQYPERLVARLNIAIDYFMYNKFRANHLNTKFYINQEKVLLNDFNTQTCSGHAYGNMDIYPMDSKGYNISLNSKLEQINIHELMYQLDNFGQTSISYDNINGKLDAVTHLTARLDPYFNIIPSSLDVNSNFIVSNGELKHYEPMYKLSKFVELSDLEHIKFNQLQNVLKIKDETLYLPQMLITSNAIDLKLSGEHSFENKFQYKMNILLSELLGKKAKKNKPQNEEFAFVEDDGVGKTSLFLLVDGIGDKIRFKYDTKSVKAHIKEGFKEEKQSMKSLLKEEFGLFKKDTTLKKPQKPKKTTKENFQIEWDDE